MVGEIGLHETEVALCVKRAPLHGLRCPAARSM
jgi:hypothetical protein